MAGSSEKVREAKIALMTALGGNFQKYLNHLKRWFQNKWSKEEFDIESRRFLTPDQMHLHNQFLIAILNKAEAFNAPQISEPENAPSSNITRTRKRKRSTKRFGKGATFGFYDFYDYWLEENLGVIRPINSSMPDVGFIMKQLPVGAWEKGVVNVDDTASECVIMAVQILLENMINSRVMKRRRYKATGEGTHYYNVGCPIEDPFVRNTVTREMGDSGIEIDKEITSINSIRRTDEDSVFLSATYEELSTPKTRIIGDKDLYKTLKDKNIIPTQCII